MKLIQLHEAAKPIAIPYDAEFKKIENEIRTDFRSRSWRFPSHIEEVAQHHKWGKNPDPAELKRKLNELNDDDQMYFLYRYGQYFKYIDNPSKAVIKFALRQEGKNLKELPKMGIPVTDEYIKMAVRQNGRMIGYVNNPTEEQMLIAVSQSSQAIHNIFKPYDKKITPGTPTQAVLDMAKKKNKAAFNDVMIKHGKFTPQEIDQAIETRGSAVRRVKNPQTQQIIAALKTSPHLIINYHNDGMKITDEMVRAALTSKKISYWTIKHMIGSKINIPHDLMLLVLNKYGYLVADLIANKISITDDMIEAALTSINLIKDSFNHARYGQHPYDKVVRQIYPTNELMQKKWIRYGVKHRGD